MKKYETIKSKKDFSYIIKNGKFNKNKYFVIYYINNENKVPTYGIAISNSYGKAYERNSIKRKVRNIIDNNKNLFKNTYNYIIMIRGTCKFENFEILNNEFSNLIKEIS